MTPKLILAVRSLLMAAVLSLAGCSTATPVPALSTQDPTRLMQSAIQTVEVGITQTALSQTTATITATFTLTPLPSATPLPTETFTPTASETPSATDTPAATSTPTAFPLSAKALYTTTYPGNQREYVPNEKFNLAIGFLNTGTIAWTSGYEIKIVGFEGEITVQPQALLGKGVEPGEKGEFNMWAYGSETLGRHIWYFQMFTDTGSPVPGGYASFSYTSK